MPLPLAALLTATLAAAAAGPVASAHRGSNPRTVDSRAEATANPDPVLAAASRQEQTDSGERAEAAPRGAIAGSLPEGFEGTALGALPAGLGGVALGALPPAPGAVVRETRYYGTVTVDHRAHLARRARCVSCHGPGPVRKIEFTPRVAHERCIGCHQEVAAGPEKCQGCHVKPPPPPEQLATTDATAPAAAPPEPNPENVAEALAAFDAPLPLHRTPDPFTRRIEAGLALGTGAGLGIRFASTQDLLVVSESLEVLRGGDRSRTLLLLGAGVCRPFNRDVMIETGAVAGVDALDRPVTAFLPVAGLRAAVQFRQPRPFPGHLTVALTWTTDLTRRAFGREVGGHALYGTVATGFRVP